MELESCIKIADGRCETPENTVKRLEPVIRSLHDYTYVEEKVSDHLYWSAIFVDGLNFRAMGKGPSPILSKAGALAEAAEWLAARAIGLLPGYVTAHQSEVENPVRIEDLLAHVASATPTVLDRVKQSDCAHHWVNGISLADGQTRKVPIEYVRRISGPNGLAAGNRLEEAIVHATNEVFERRAHVTVLKNRLVMPTIDTDTIRHPVIRAQLEFIRGKGIEVIVKDLSFGGVLPCVGTYFLDPSIPEDYQFHHFFKVGASFDREYALMRTFTEYTQGRRLDEFIQGRKEEQERVLRHDFRNLRCMVDDGDNLMSAFMFGFVPYGRADFLKEGPCIPFEPGEGFTDCLDDINAAKAIFAELGKDYVVVDFTDPDIGFPVVEVVAPGYSDVLPFHPATSRVLFQSWTRDDVLRSYAR